MTVRMPSAPICLRKTSQRSNNVSNAFWKSSLSPDPSLCKSCTIGGMEGETPAYTTSREAVCSEATLSATDARMSKQFIKARRPCGSSVDESCLPLEISRSGLSNRSMKTMNAACLACHSFSVTRLPAGPKEYTPAIALNTVFATSGCHRRVSSGRATASVCISGMNTTSTDAGLMEHTTDDRRRAADRRTLSGASSERAPAESETLLTTIVENAVCVDSIMLSLCCHNSIQCVKS
ncbi:hypothetical protein M427DRAFT_201655 [Gonapodya prolifera JEL478]|uniref:Uncharacterized protein n=1 Tax=Gonapodya prolifera (strain JEL478) TaxID=1344416 RepID=A0A139A017_GONPJ|nr:hypothetical protein M427DRAFT_201655 [Gonapodya prolifera JEL478]|eukprot:KXS09978.1 hypothetical protein M427DRAFT_201655 [Gonapodya prolifera JEL478]